MKPFEAQSYYELLEVSVSATRGEIEAAFTRLSRLYGDDQMSLYGLVEPQRARELKSRLDEALQVLTNDDLRAEYDKRIGLPPREVARAPEPATQLPLPEVLRTADSEPASSGGRVAVNWVPKPPPSRPEEPALLGTANAGASVSAPRFGSTRSVSGEVSTGQPTSRSEPPQTDDAAPSTAAAPSAEADAQGNSATVRPLRKEAPILAQESAMALLEPRPEPAREAPKPAEPPPPAESRPAPFEVPDGAVFNGPLLRRVREARGLSLQLLAERTRIGLRHLENVEADRYAQLPVAVYLRGMLMSLSRELGIDGLKVSKSYLSLMEQAKEQSKG